MPSPRPPGAGPPRVPLTLLAALLPRAERDEVLADVADEFGARARAEGAASARRWLWGQALGSAPALLGWNWWRGWTGFEPRANVYRPGGPMLRSWIADLQYAARRLRARPGYGLLAVLTLALGVGGTAAVFGITRGLLFDPLPYANEGQIGVFWNKFDWNEQEFLHLRGRFPGFRQVTMFRPADVTLREGDAPARLLPGVSATAELFDVLGVRPVIGRGFRPGDDAMGAEPVVVLSHGLWQELGGAQDIVGKRLTLDGTPRTVVGVMAPGFWFPDPGARIWAAEPLDPENRSGNYAVVGRVAPGQDLSNMSAPVASLTKMLGERFTYSPQWDKTKNAKVTPIREDLMGSMRPALLATLAAMGLILLIACANVAALMLGQVDARAAELAVRSALGANRRRLTQQLVVEALVISAVAGAFGAALAWGGFRLLARALPLGAWGEAAVPDWRVFVGAMGIAMLAAVLVVLVPTISLWRGDLRGALGRARTGGLEGRGGRLENGLVVAEVALAVLIASGAALLVRSVTNLYAIDPGLRSEGVAVVDVVLGGGQTAEVRRQTLLQLVGALGEMPGVRSAAAVQRLPLRGGGDNWGITIPGRPELEASTTAFRIVTPAYFETMGIALRDGRGVTASDRGEAEPVVVINEALAKKYFPGINPIGQYVSAGFGAARPARIVGVVPNVAEKDLTAEREPARYVSAEHLPYVAEGQSLVLRAAPGVDPASLLDAARRTVSSVAPGVAVEEVTTMGHVLDRAVGPARQVMSLLSLLTGLALTLGAVGIYGVIAHFAARRQRDWAIRVALGLPGSRVVAHVVGHGAVLVAAGIGLGVLSAAALARLLASLLYGVSAVDPLALAAASAALLTVGLLAALFPARRAGTTDPAIALRQQ